MLTEMRSYLEQKQAFTGPLPPILDKVVDAIPYTTIPDRMKQVIAISEIMTFAAQFRRNIAHWDGIEVPINTVGFVITGSGQNKDSSVKAAKNCFSVGYKDIDNRRREYVKAKAIRQAEEAGESNASDFSVYKSYLMFGYTDDNQPDIPPIRMAPTTGPGLIQHFNDIDRTPYGSGLLYTGEVGDELALGGDIEENIKIISEVYDTGDRDGKYTKSVESRSKAIQGLGGSALFIGSPAHLLYDESIKRKFMIAFMSKLARRSWFCFVPGLITEDFGTDPEAAIDAKIAIEEKAYQAREKISEGIKIFTEHQLAKDNALIEVDDSVRRLFVAYQMYNTKVAEEELNPHGVSALIRRHLQWKALKLSGAIAMFDMSDTITEDHYLQAIRFCELLSNDMDLFETELNKTPYERFADYIKTQADNEGKAMITLHDLKKKGYIPSVSNPATKLKELRIAASSYDQEGIYTVNSDSTAIYYERIIQTDKAQVSYFKVDNSPIFNAIDNNLGPDAIRSAKSSVAQTAASGFKTIDITFPDLAELLQGDFAYTPFALKDGKRGKDFISSGAKWLVLDIDESTVTYEEAHFMLEDINHHIALSSNKDNPFKFRILIELESNVNVNHNVWKHFTKLVATDLGFNADPVPQSQVFFSYSGRPILSVTDREPLHVKPYIDEANELASLKQPITEKKLTTPQKQALIDDKLTTFAQAFDAQPGSRSIELIKAAHYAKALGMSKDDIKDLMYEIVDYWPNPMDPDRLERTIISQIERFP